MAELFHHCRHCGAVEAGHTTEACLRRQLTNVTAALNQVSHQMFVERSQAEDSQRVAGELMRRARVAWRRLAPFARASRIRYIVDQETLQLIDDSAKDLELVLGEGLETRELIASLRGGIPAACDFCGDQVPPDALEPEEAGMWACPDCWRRFREADALALAHVKETEDGGDRNPDQCGAGPVATAAGPDDQDGREQGA